jgi:hypothetical protein
MPPKRSNKTLKKKLYKTNQILTKEENPASNMAVMNCNGSWNWVDVWPKCRMPKKIQSRFVASTQSEKKVIHPSSSWHRGAIKCLAAIIHDENEMKQIECKGMK